MRDAGTMCEIVGVITPSKIAVDQAAPGTSSGVTISYGATLHHHVANS